MQDVADVLENLDISKACGPDLISSRLLKEGSSILARPFSFIFNSSLAQGIFPTPWKDSNITPIHIKDDKSMPSNFRPVSLLSQECKVMKRCIHKHFYNYIVENNILTPFQSGFFRRGILQPISSCILIICFVRQLRVARKYESYCVTLVKPLTGSGIGVYCTS